MTRFTDKEKKTLVDITLQNMLPATREYIIEKRRKSDDDDDKEALLIVAEEVKVDDGKKYSILFRALADSIERTIEKMTELMSDEEIDFLAFYHERTHKVVFLGDSKKYHPETFEQWAYRLRNSGLVEARQKQGGKNKKKEYWMVISRPFGDSSHGIAMAAILGACLTLTLALLFLFSIFFSISLMITLPLLIVF
jgi:DNA-binding transcriptional ArsR family regulator